MDSTTKLDTQQWVRKLRVTPLLTVGGVVLAMIGLALWLRGARFYTLPLAARVEHPDFARLSPSRALGEAYGIAGLAMLLFNLAYLLRKRVPHWPVGRMRIWLDLHVLTGFAAAVFAFYHSAFQWRSPVALVTTAAMVITVFTGVVGRFFHALGCSNGANLAERLATLDALVPGVRRPFERGLTQLMSNLSARQPGRLRALPLLSRCRHAALPLRGLLWDTYGARIGLVPRSQWPYAQRVATDVERLAVREVYAVLGRQLLRAWRPWHRLCALTVVGGVTLHAAIAAFYGYL